MNLQDSLIPHAFSWYVLFIMFLLSLSTVHDGPMDHGRSLSDLSPPSGSVRLIPPPTHRTMERVARPVDPSSPTSCILSPIIKLYNGLWRVHLRMFPWPTPPPAALCNRIASSASSLQARKSDLRLVHSSGMQAGYWYALLFLGSANTKDSCCELGSPRLRLLDDRWASVM